MDKSGGDVEYSGLFDLPDVVLKNRTKRDARMALERILTRSIDQIKVIDLTSMVKPLSCFFLLSVVIWIICRQNCTRDGSNSGNSSRVAAGGNQRQCP